MSSGSAKSWSSVSESMSSSSCGTCSGCVTPDILSDTVSYFGGGASCPAGGYLVYYDGGAMWYNKDDPDKRYAASLDNSIAFRVVSDGIPFEIAGFVFGACETLAELEAHKGEGVSFYHGGGRIGVHLIDTLYSDNIAMGGPSPSFCIQRLN